MTFVMRIEAGGGERRKTREKLRRGKGKSRRNKSGEEEIKRKNVAFLRMSSQVSCLGYRIVGVA